MTIQRYVVNHIGANNGIYNNRMAVSSNGKYVLYSDHVKAVREAKAEAWEEGWHSGWETGYVDHKRQGDEPNPYRESEE